MEQIDLFQGNKEKVIPWEGLYNVTFDNILIYSVNHAIIQHVQYPSGVTG